MVNSKRLYTFSLLAAIFFFTLIAHQAVWGGVPCNQDADCDDGVFCNGTEVCVTNQTNPKQCSVGYPAAPGCVPCADKITQLTLLNAGPKRYIRVYDGKRPKPTMLLFEGWVNGGGTFTFTGLGSGGEMGQQVSIWVGNDRGCLIETIIHTSCHNSVAPGLVRGDFVVVEAHTPDGALCPISPLPCPDDGQYCNGSECDEDTDSCVVSADPCPDDGQFCNGMESCDEAQDQCVSTGDPCPDDGTYCNGTESCNEAGDRCESSNDRCPPPLLCDEPHDRCVNCLENADCDDGIGCTTDTCDQYGNCRNEPSDAACDDGIPCTADTCDPQRGCDNEPRDTACDNGNYCDGVETCDPDAGCQDSTAPCAPPLLCDEAGNRCVNCLVASDCNDGVSCTTDACNDGTCQNEPSDGACDDGVACTVDTCDPQYDCRNQPDDVACDDGDYCDGAEACNLLTGCQDSTDPCAPPLLCDEVGDRCVKCLDASDCNDGVSCTTDACVDGNCQNEPSDGACNDGVACTADTCDPQYDCQNQPDDASCDNGNYCDGAETCNPVAGCKDGTDPCVPPLVCDETGDQCVNCVDAADCDDGIGCTTDTCVNGSCQNTPSDGACNDGVACTADTCDSQYDCQHEPRDAACDDGVACTVDTCDMQSDCKHKPSDGACDDGVACTVDTCDLQNDCQHLPKDVLCDDGDYCDGAETCDPGAGCQDGPDPCAPPLVCDDAHEQCVSCLVAADCDDGIGCTADACVNGSCKNTPSDSVCNDGVACTVDTCDLLNDCQHLPKNVLCGDGDYCTGVETCDPVAGCQDGPDPCAPPLVCDDAHEQCVNCLVAADCNDGIDCTTDACVNGICKNTASDGACNDGVSCTVDTCDLQNDCQHLPKDVLCDNGDYCDGAETCDPDAGCLDGPDPCAPPLVCDEAHEQCVNCLVAADCDDGIGCTTDACVNGICKNTATDGACDDGVSCTVDTCDLQNDCQHLPKDVLCDNGDYCDGAETCDSLAGCQDNADPCAPPLVCDEAGDRCVNCIDDAGCNDGIGCTTDACDQNGSCRNTPSDGACNDGVSCTVDTCDLQNDCQHMPSDPACDNGVYCDGAETCDPLAGCQDNADPCAPPLVCDEAGDRCVNCVDDAGCNDGVSCTTDACVNGNCQNTASDGACDDGVSCTADTCDPQLGCQHQPDDVACDDGIPCTVDNCDVIQDCDSTPDDSLCDNGMYCDGGEICNPSAGCQDSAAPCAPPLLCDEAGNRCVNCLGASDCNDGVSCTTDTCVNGTCQNTPDNGSCDDGLFCNGTERCDPLSGCQGGPDPCPSGTQCSEITDTCNATTTTIPATTTTTTVPGEADVVFQQSSIYYNPSEEGGETVKRKVCLDNPSDLVGGIQFDECEYNVNGSPADCMSCIDCELTERTTMFDCAVLELPNGCCRVVLFCKNPGCAINPGVCDIVTIVYKTFPLSEECPGMDCGVQIPEHIVVSDYNGFSLTASALPANICPIVCGDVCPPDNPGPGWDCGDGQVDIYDIMCEVDFALTTIADTCQLYRADVPTGTPPWCTEPDGSVNILDIMVLIDMSLNRQDCCSFYYEGVIY